VEAKGEVTHFSRREKNQTKPTGRPSRQETTLTTRLC
jgi:hypothetical protein